MIRDNTTIPTAFSDLWEGCSDSISCMRTLFSYTRTLTVSYSSWASHDRGMLYPVGPRIGHEWEQPQHQRLLTTTSAPEELMNPVLTAEHTLHAQETPCLLHLGRRGQLPWAQNNLGEQGPVTPGRQSFSLHQKLKWEFSSLNLHLTYSWVRPW